MGTTYKKHKRHATMGSAHEYGKYKFTTMGSTHRSKTSSLKLIKMRFGFVDINVRNTMVKLIYDWNARLKMIFQFKIEAKNTLIGVHTSAIREKNMLHVLPPSAIGG